MNMITTLELEELSYHVTSVFPLLSWQSEIREISSLRIVFPRHRLVARQAASVSDGI